MLNVVDEFTHECLAIRINRKLKAIDVIDVLCDLFILRGVPGHIRSDNGPEFVAKAVQKRIAAVGAKTAYIEPGSPWENGCIESLNARLRDELLNGEIFYTLREAQIVIESWRRHDNAIARMPHSAINHQHRRSSCLHYPPGRLRYVDQLRRPRWRKRQLSTNIPPGPLNGGCSLSRPAQAQARGLETALTTGRHDPDLQLQLLGIGARSSRILWSLPRHRALYATLIAVT
jgi:hypothetical protein